MIVLLAAGTRGDVQPAVALARGLRAAGRRVRLITHPEFFPLAAGYGVESAALDGNPSEWMTHSGGQSALTYDGNWLRSARASLAYLRAARPLLERLLDSAWTACREAHPALVVFGLPAPWGVTIAEALGVPAVGAFLQPITPTTEHPSALLPTTYSAGRLYNRLSHRLVALATWLPWRGVINRWRRERLGLAAAGGGGPLSELQTGQHPMLYGYSAQVAGRPAGWPANHHITGYWFLDAPAGYEPPAALCHFLEAGPPPVYITFGSPGARDLQRLLEIVGQAIQQSGVRAIFGLTAAALAGIAALGGEKSRADWFAAGDVPHAWLLPRCRGMIHHGGAGSTAAGLRAGLPSLLTPMAVDQFFWAQRVAALGVGPEPIPQRVLSLERLLPALQKLASDETMHSRAGALGARIQAEDGVARAVEIISRF